MTGGSGPAGQKIAEIRAGEALFDSRGFSRVKVTKDGRPAVLEMPIRSNGVWELMEDLARKAPRPPVRAEWIAADSDLGRQLGLDRDRPVMMFDTTDQAYLDRLAEHHRRVLWGVILAGLDTAVLDQEGRPVEEPARVREILLENGLTEHQAEKIFKDIQALTRLEEKIEDFFYAGP